MSSNENESEVRSDGEWLAEMGTDAAKWAAEFARVLARGGITLDPTPGDLLHAWFCNAIEAGRTAGYSTARDRFDPDWLSRLTAPESEASS